MRNQLPVASFIQYREILIVKPKRDYGISFGGTRAVLSVALPADGSSQSLGGVACVAVKRPSVKGKRDD